MACCKLTVKVSICWWVPVYLNALIVFCKLLGTEPDMGRVEQFVKRGIKVTTR